MFIITVVLSRDNTIFKIEYIYIIIIFNECAYQACNIRKNVWVPDGNLTRNLVIAGQKL